MRVLAAMSGGVDSAVAAARAADAGHEVTGIHLALSENPRSYRSGARGCCTLEDARDARRAADVIGIPFFVWDMARKFHDAVVQDFVDEYAAGHTPNPCLRCNERIKFTAVLGRALALGFDAVCTGHHARLDGGMLRRGADQAKDQSYVLAVLNQAQLARAVFPVGDSTKDQVRAEAASRGLGVAAKPDSHDVCFIPDGDTRGFLRRALGSRPGPLVDPGGQVVGGHDGSYGFTIGQRRGLGIDMPAPDGRPRYVLGIEPVSGTVRVGPAPSLDVDRIGAVRPVWTGLPAPAGPVRCLVQLRAHGEALPATCVPADRPAGGAPAAHGASARTGDPAGHGASADRRAGGPDGRREAAQDDRAALVIEDDRPALVIELDRPARGVAAGQAAVLYDGDLVLGSATISAAWLAGRDAPAAGARRP